MDAEQWKERQEAKAERCRELADKARSRSEAANASARRIADIIPMGQPILIGHHSEGRHRRDLARIHLGYDKAIEESGKADHYKRKADSIENPRAISSDNPDAIALLKAKLSAMEGRREAYRAKNKELRASGEEPLPSYALSNLAGNIGTVKKRIAWLEQQQSAEYATVERDGIEVSHNKEINRIQIRFPGIPPEETRHRLKSNGFRWSPREGVWQRQPSPWAYHLALGFFPGSEERQPVKDRCAFCQWELNEGEGVKLDDTDKKFCADCAKGKKRV